MKRLITIALTAVVTVVSAVPVVAADYIFDAKDTTSYYRSTDYTDIYSTEYNYGGTNVIDFEHRIELPGLYTPEPGIMTIDNNVYGLIDSGTIYTAPTIPSTEFIYTTTAFTPARELVRSDGSIGTLEIPTLRISMKAYDGTGSDSMAKGAGHFSESSGWDGNICLAGHNRGAKYVIGGIKDLKLGDTIKYTTTRGTRTYSVSFVGTISSTDWSYITGTLDNRITLITCVSNQPSLRTVVQAIEI